MRTGNAARALPAGYFAQSELPLASLALLLPLLVLYEVGTRHFASNAFAGTEHRIIAFKLMQDFFHLFGASGRYLPALAIVGVLLAWHIARNDPWRVKPGTLAGMTAEGCFLGLPLLAIGILGLRYMAAGTASDWRGMVVLSIGAGIYEELVFRLIAFTLLHLLLVDLLDLPASSAGVITVLAASLLFSVYHYLGDEPFEWRTFAFRTFAGIYFGIVFLFRGFGITACSHASYDVCVVALKVLARG
ncbi:MAG TPA: CPBP family intramembrane glutamic endopeptidase [Tepidisphaeraceae bacterium]|nr:CPBP family intramembrane glutamic endopeptidase [Tepidisphaeraceae bacterium]